MPVQESARVYGGGRADIGRIERDMLVSGAEEVTEQGSLAGLSRAGEGKGRKFAYSAP
jgi:hypothetical protein